MVESTDSIDGSVKALEKALGVHEGFLEGLINEDDWSFIIKAHALLEAAVTHLLCKALQKDKLLPIFSFLELSNKSSGKIAFVKALDLLDKEDRRFISSLSELRNKLVHNVSNVNFGLQAFVNELSPKELSEFVTKFDSFTLNNSTAEYQGKWITSTELFKREAKRAIWYSCMVTVGIIYKKREISFIEARIKRHED
ncbi:MAG: hypothetical protein H7Y42_10780 [Chitinophagaceae bacterium]|nr:hypothetical protein [Chitinophagaceae bacterium]